MNALRITELLKDPLRQVHDNEVSTSEPDKVKGNNSKRKRVKGDIL
jgi:hypothetical protein